MFRMLNDRNMHFRPLYIMYSIYWRRLMRYAKLKNYKLEVKFTL